MTLLLAVGLTAASAGSAPEPQPNIVYILADDLGYGDVGCYNPRGRIPTPHLDRMATQGARFTDAHAPASVCTPTRYALLTGRYCWRSPLKSGVLGPWDAQLIPSDRLTVPRFLQQQGYETACIGKWHLGWNWPTRDGRPAASGPDRLSNVDFTQPIGGGPLTLGFDRYFGVDLPNYPPYCFIDGDRTVGIPSVPDTGRAEGFNRPGPMVPGWKLVDILPELTRRTVNYLEQPARRNRPFFLYVPLPSPHYPVVPSTRFQGKSGLDPYSDFVMETDWAVGEILKALDRNGLSRRTLVVFTSDNGPEVTGEVVPGVYDRAREFGHYSQGELRGAKRDTWEGGHRVPFIVRWPGRVVPGRVSTARMCHVDLLATLADLLRKPLPESAGEDSESVLPALLSRADEAGGREAIVHHGISGKFALRLGDWVYIDAATGDENGGPMRRGEPTWLKMQRGYKQHPHPGELYNLREDPAQVRNRYAEEPERVRAMREELLRVRNAGRSRPPVPAGTS